MIEVNLLPGGKSNQRGGFSLKLPGFGKKPRDKRPGAAAPRDKWVMAATLIGVLAAGTIGWLYRGTSTRTEELTLAIEDAVRDSTRFADLIAQTEGLRARRDSIGQKVQIIQEIDGERYVWPHVLDEVARALPEYTWLTALLQVEKGESLIFRLEGRAGNNFALTRFMENLESSPFIRDVRLVTTEQIEEASGEGTQRQVHQFQLDASYESPPTELIETVPLFATPVGELVP